jgi:hypothetical protein
MALALQMPGNKRLGDIRDMGDLKMVHIFMDLSGYVLPEVIGGFKL